MSSDTVMVAVGRDDTELVVVAMSERVERAHADDPYCLDGFFRETVPRETGLWLWEGSYEDSDADGEWRRPTVDEITKLHEEDGT